MSKNELNKKENENIPKKKKKTLLDRIPHPLVLLFYIIVLAAILTYIIPSGEFERVTMESDIGTVTKPCLGVIILLRKIQ